MNIGGWKYASLRLSAYLNGEEALLVAAPLPSNPGRRVRVTELTLRVDTRAHGTSDVNWEGHGRFVLKDGSAGKQRTQRAVKVTADEIPAAIQRAMLEEAGVMVSRQRQAILDRGLALDPGVQDLP